LSKAINSRDCAKRSLNCPGQLRLRFAQSRELIAFDKGVFHE